MRLDTAEDVTQAVTNRTRVVAISHVQYASGYRIDLKPIADMVHHAGGLLCVEGKCAGCTKSNECRVTELCDPVQRLCTLRACFGDECAAHSDCKLGSFCVQPETKHKSLAGSLTSSLSGSDTGTCGAAGNGAPGARVLGPAPKRL